MWFSVCTVKPIEIFCPYSQISFVKQNEKKNHQHENKEAEFVKKKKNKEAAYLMWHYQTIKPNSYLKFILYQWHEGWSSKLYESELRIVKDEIIEKEKLQWYNRIR